MKKPMRIGWLILVTAGIYTPTLFSQGAAEPLQIYWIDVDGGSSTLIVTPGGDSILMDAGWNREDARDAQRIQSAMADAGVSEINYFIASHFHGDHVGGTPALPSVWRFTNFLTMVRALRQTQNVEGLLGKRISVWPKATDKPFNLGTHYH
jgi:beta-lactamase superfamily II metal-dependent hydrolase